MSEVRVLLGAHPRPAALRPGLGHGHQRDASFSRDARRFWYVVLGARMTDHSSAGVPAAATSPADDELVIGLVAPVGTDLDHVEASLVEALEKYEFSTRLHRLSSFLQYDMVARLVPEIDETSEYGRISTLMDAGDALRDRTGLNEILALYAGDAIKRSRGSTPRPMPRTAHVLRSLKRPEEVFALRRIYGAAFLLIGVYVPHDDRIRNLTRRGMTEPQAQALVTRDEKGSPDARPRPHGQKTPRPSNWPISSSREHGDAPASSKSSSGSWISSSAVRS